MNERSASESTDGPAKPNSALSAETPTLPDASVLSRKELQDQLSVLEADLEDLEEERMFVLGQTGVHLSASTVQRYENEVTRLKERITEIRRVLESAQSD